MLFVPVAPPPPPSPRIRELADRLKAEVERYRQDHPGTSDRDVRLALRYMASRVGTRGTARTVATLIAGLAALAGVGTALFLSGSREAAAIWEELGPHGIIGILVAVFAVVTLLVRTRR